MCSYELSPGDSNTGGVSYLFTLISNQITQKMFDKSHTELKKKNVFRLREQFSLKANCCHS